MLGEGLRGLALGYAAWLGVALGVALAAAGVALVALLVGILLLPLGYAVIVASGYLVYRGGRRAWSAYEELASGVEAGDLVYIGALLLRYSGIAAFLGSLAVIVLLGLLVLPVAYLAYTLGAALYTAGLAMASERLGIVGARTPLLLAALGAGLDLLGVTSLIGFILFIAGALVAAGRIEEAGERRGLAAGEAGGLH